MAQVVTFVGYRPPPRYDALPWTHARIDEAPTESGAWTVLETIALSPLDTDPAHPVARSFTTELGTALDYWYRVAFVDATGDTSQPTDPVQNVAGGGPTPTAEPYVSVAELQRIVFTTSTPTSAQTDAMDRVLRAAAAEINWDLGYPASVTPHPILADVNLDRAVELWKANSSPHGIMPQGPEQAPVVAPRDTWYRHHLRLNPLRTSWGIG